MSTLKKIVSPSCNIPLPSRPSWDTHSPSLGSCGCKSSWSRCRSRRSTRCNPSDCMYSPGCGNHSHSTCKVARKYIPPHRLFGRPRSGEGVIFSCRSHRMTNAIQPIWPQISGLITNTCFIETYQNNGHQSDEKGWSPHSGNLSLLFSRLLM